ncbi:hypothetical protein [Variovorax paradoxus]|uniref:hypothetical protein n=1 Tax=Variovorax paradoxus TaxID=34073 RepID=UPI003D64EB40
MNHPPASAREYWDRILKLAKDNGGSFTLDQIHEEFDLTSKEIKKIAKLVEKKPVYDAVDNYEFAEDRVQAWKARSISEGYEEEKLTFPDKDRKNRLMDLRVMAYREFNSIDIDDQESVQAIRLKYTTLNQIALALQHKGVLHGWF